MTCNPLPAAPAAIALIALPRRRERLAGFVVSRLLGELPGLAVGPFLLFDDCGPVDFAPGVGLDAGPHPHVGMATLTYVYEGALLHRDGMGNAQEVTAGGANWMIAGRGAAHSERTPAELRRQASRLAFAQLWLALPPELEEAAPSFSHHPAESLPTEDRPGLRLRVIAGTFGPLRSPVPVTSPTLCADAELAADGTLDLSAEHQERAVYIRSGEVEVGGQRFAAGQMLIFHAGDTVRLSATMPSRALLLGGARLEEPRLRWSTVIARSPARVAEAKADWEARRIPSVVGEPERGAFPAM